MDLERLATIIEASGASVVSLNEVLHPVYTHYSETRPLEQLANLLRMDWAFGESNRIVQRPGWWGPVGNAVLSRHPIVSDANHYLPRLPLTQGRNLLAARLQLGSGFTIYSTHLDHAFEGTRMWQLRGVLERLLKSQRSPHLLMGDFNTHTPLGAFTQRFAPPVVRMLRSAGYVDAYAAAGAGNPVTFDFLFPWFRIDYIFVPRHMSHRLLSCRSLQGDLVQVASDHRPVLAELDWQQ
jgi:endonuclease/exonuclease/phosphatase family metal-dependent hydrolase